MEQSRTELVRQLLEYRRFKEAAALLSERAAAQSLRFGRGAGEIDRNVDPAEQPNSRNRTLDLVSASAASCGEYCSGGR